SLAGCLDVLCDLAGGERIGWAVQDGAVVISLREDLAKSTVAKAHSVPSAFRSKRTPDAQPVEPVMQILRQVVDPALGGRGEESEVQRGKLTLTAPAATHEKIEELFALCNKGMRGSDWGILDAGKQLDQTDLPTVEFDGAAFQDVVAHFREVTGANLVVNWRALAQVGIDGAAKVSVRLNKVTAGKALLIVLEDVGKGRGAPVLTAVADGQVLMITASHDAGRHKHMVAFDLRSRPKTKKVKEVQELIQLVRQNVAPQSWGMMGPRAGVLVEVTPTRLICVQTADHIAAVAEFLDQTWGLRYRIAQLQPGTSKSDKPDKPGKETPSETRQKNRETKAQNKLKLADMYFKMGMKDKAREFYGIVVREFPGTKAAATAKKKLDAMR
ncbi:MAG TPA: tetratricopeptide repeat protein, partial [Phycisphaerae bacterium]|nr:tetratricopeptide repeat protein [Phycisphaerae bacterium]